MSEIVCYGDVGWGITADWLRRMLDGADGDVTLRIHSYGGDVSEGIAIYNVIRHARANGRRVTAVVDGIAASAASYMALSADRVLMGPGTDMFLHEPCGGVYGYAGDMRAFADELDKCRNDIVGIYERKTGRTASEVERVMRDETRFTAREAIDWGLADGMDESDSAPDVRSIDEKWRSISRQGEFAAFAARAALMGNTALAEQLPSYYASSERMLALSRIGNPAPYDRASIIQPTDDVRDEAGAAPAEVAGEAPAQRVLVGGRIYEIPSNGE